LARKLLKDGRDEHHLCFKEGTNMLVLTRKIGESIVIDGCITVTITDVSGNKVRLGISAPPEVPVDREEVHRRLCEFSNNPHELIGAAGPETGGTSLGGESAIVEWSGNRSSSLSRPRFPKE
jgi:carbon storage regulator